MHNKVLLAFSFIILSMPLMATAYIKAQDDQPLGFENKDVEQAYHDQSRDLTTGIFFTFKLNEIPNEKEKKIIVDITKQAGLTESEITHFKTAMIWGFDWLYWRFNEEGTAVCEQFKEKKAYRLWQHCNSNKRALVWSD